jgi:hypothetical protein
VVFSVVHPEIRMTVTVIVRNNFFMNGLILW